MSRHRANEPDTEQFVCFMAHRFRLLDDYGLRQVVLPAPSALRTPAAIWAATCGSTSAERRGLAPAQLSWRSVTGTAPVPSAAAGLAANAAIAPT